MSSYVKSSCSRSRRDTSHSGKPGHVKRLNFAPLMLELDTVTASLNRDHLVDQNVAHIPCTSKNDYIRKWIETQESNGYDRSVESIQSSLAPGRSATKIVETSPIIGSNRKRRRTRINRRAAEKSASNADCQENAGRPANYKIRAELDCENAEKSEDEETRSSEIHCAEHPTGNESSPVLGKHIFSRKRKRRRSRSVVGDVVSSEHLHQLNDEVNANANPMTESDNNRDTLKEVSVNCENVQENSKTEVKAALFSIEATKGLEKLEIALSSPEKLQERLSFQDSSSSKDIPKIEVGTSDEEIDSEHENCNETSSIENDSDNLNNIIEDTDTQEIARTPQLSVPDKSFVPSLFIPSQVAIDNLNETYCSEAEMMLGTSTHLSAMISEVPSLKENTQKTGNKSTQSDAIISSITTPSKKSPDKSMYTQLLDSGKKRRKPKKGSMVAKLQSLVNAQISGLRIWHHRMNKNPHDPMEFIRILVHGCTQQFGNQFLQGTLIEDRFNLLQDDILIEEAEQSDNVQSSSSISKTRSRETLCRNITVMLVCDIVGTLKMTSKVVINVYPPWNILDKDDLTLEASYISINNNREIPDILNRNNLRKKRIIKEFNCPCIEELRELPFCARKPNGEKPDVIERIFDF